MLSQVPMGREQMLSGACATSGRHVSTWAHAILGGKTPHTFMQVYRENLHATNVLLHC
jgi:hypothetical protein